MLMVPNSISSRISRSYSERVGWVSIGEKNEYFTLAGRLTAFVRMRRLSPHATFNPGDFLHTANLSFEPFIYVPMAVLAVIGLFFAHRDLNASDHLTETGIDVVDYWSLEQHHFAYEDVERVVIRCFFTDKGEAVEAYELELPGDRSLQLYENAKRVASQFEAYEAIDSKLRAAKVSFVPGAHRGWFKTEERGYDVDCVDRVAKDFSTDLQDRVKAIFHREELSASELIWPWDPDLAEAKRAADVYDVDKALAVYSAAIDSGRLSPHLEAIAYKGRARARENYTITYGPKDEELLAALRDYEKARKLEPTLAAFSNEANALVELGAYEEATAALKQALALDKPRPHWSLIGLARVERIRGSYDGAMQYLDQLMRVWGDDAGMAIYYHRGWVLYLKGDFAASVDALTKGLEDQPDFSSAYRFRMCANAEMGEVEKALADGKQASAAEEAMPGSISWQKTPYAAAINKGEQRSSRRLSRLNLERGMSVIWRNFVRTLGTTVRTVAQKVPF